MFGWLFLLFTVLPALEIWLFFQIPIDLGSKLLIVLFTGIAGASLARAQGWKVMSEVQQTLQQGGLPARELLHGAIVLFGGALLLTPGFITDTIGFLCLLPPTRALIAAGLTRYFKGRVKLSASGMAGARGGAAWSFSAGPVREPSRGPELHEEPPTPGRLDLGAHAGRPARPPATIDASFSVVDEED